MPKVPPTHASLPQPSASSVARHGNQRTKAGAGTNLVTVDSRVKPRGSSSNAGPARRSDGLVKTSQLAVGLLATTALVRGASASNAEAASGLVPLASPVHTGVSPGVPFHYKRSLQVPLGDYLAKLTGNMGQEEGDPRQVKEMMLKPHGRHGNVPQLDPPSIERLMQKFKPQVIDQAFTLSSFCGHNERKIEHAIQRCLPDLYALCAKIEAGQVVGGTRPEDCNAYSTLDERMAHLANVARLVMIKASARRVDHRYGVPMFHAPRELVEPGGGAEAVSNAFRGGRYLKPGLGPDRPGYVVFTNVDEIGRWAEVDDLGIVKVLGHEACHDLCHEGFYNALDSNPVCKPHANKIWEAAVEFDFTQTVSKNATDSLRETLESSNRFMLRVLEDMTQTSPLTEKAYNDGMDLFKDAFEAGIETALQKFAESSARVVQTYGPPIVRANLAEPDSLQLPASMPSTAADRSAPDVALVAVTPTVSTSTPTAESHDRAKAEQPADEPAGRSWARTVSMLALGAGTAFAATTGLRRLVPSRDPASTTPAAAETPDDTIERLPANAKTMLRLLLDDPDKAFSKSALRRESGNAYAKAFNSALRRLSDEGLIQTGTDGTIQATDRARELRGA